MTRFIKSETVSKFPPVKLTRLETNHNSSKYNVHQGNVYQNMTEHSAASTNLLNDKAKLTVLNNLLKKVINSNSSLYGVQSQVYNFSKVNVIQPLENKVIYIALKYVFYSLCSLITKPAFSITPRLVDIHLGFYLTRDPKLLKKHYSLQPLAQLTSTPEGADLNGSLASGALNKEIGTGQDQSGKLFNLNKKFFPVNDMKLQKLGVILTHIFNRNVQLKLVQLYYPYEDSNILAEFIALNLKQYKFYRVEDMLFSKAIIDKTLNKTTSNSFKSETSLVSILNGIKVKLSGRLVTEKSVPKSTVSTIQRGGFAKNNLNLNDYSTFTTKNKKGAFTIKVWMSHKIAH